MPTFDVHVVMGKTALVPLDEIFPECKTLSSERTPRLVCLPEPNVCSSCKSLPALVRRVAGLFKASEWQLVVAYWTVEEQTRTVTAEGQKRRFTWMRRDAVGFYRSDPSEVLMLGHLNPTGFKRVLEAASVFTVTTPLYT